MKIGIKYCGGCNPNYDRTDVITRLKIYMGQENSIEPVKPGIIYDIVIILCGCTSACVNHSKIEFKYEKILITSKDDIIKLYNLIDKIKNNL